jgi:hypothetical protein
LPDSAISIVGAGQLATEMRDELALARETLKAELRDSRAGQTLCVPFTLGGPTLVSVARELGMDALFWGVSPASRINRPGNDPLRLVRLKSDFIHRLPGSKRESLSAIYLSKLRRRLAGQRPY